MPTFIGRSAGLITQPSANSLKFNSPVPRNPMLIPGFIESECAPISHTHSQGDITGAGAAASAATRGIFISVAGETNSPGGSIKAYFEVRNGLSARASENWLIEAFTDASANPPVLPRGTALSQAVMDTGTFYASVLAAAERAKDFLFRTTNGGSAVVIYSESAAAASVFLGAILVGPVKANGALVFTA